MNGEAAETLKGWFAGRVPGDWFTGVPGVSGEGMGMRMKERAVKPPLQSGSQSHSPVCRSLDSFQ